MIQPALPVFFVEVTTTSEVENVKPWDICRVVDAADADDALACALLRHDPMARVWLYQGSAFTVEAAPMTLRDVDIAPATIRETRLAA